MKRWDYVILEVNGGVGVAQSQYRDMGDAGWELVHVEKERYPRERDPSEEIWREATFKREIEDYWTPPWWLWAVTIVGGIAGIFIGVFAKMGVLF